MATVAPRMTRPSFRRSRSNRVIGGVAAGVGQHLGIDPLVVRLAFVALTFALGFGLVVYLLLWLLARAEPLDAVAVTERRRLKRPTFRQILGGILVVAGIGLMLAFTGFWFGEITAWPVILAAIGFAILWARSGEEGTARSLFGSRPLEAVVASRGSLTRFAIGAALILTGMAVFLAANTSLAAAGNMLLAVVVALGGAALLAGPWVWRMGRELVEERNSRIRTEAHAEMAAHLHDSVLQTLALIQRSGTTREMTSLARTQERDLRAWLYGRAPAVAGMRLRDAVDAMAGKVERSEQVSVEAVVVGDTELDEPMRALLAACGEATSNAARHSGATEISVYVEVEPERVSAFVRDQGGGFDPAAVPDDRHGIADSIAGRMERHGGSAEINSRPGGGTEVALRLPRRAAREGSVERQAS
ncbi:MAG TPA: PspC domain-containing protein [Candidatus Dormibacteraeota bacterium]|nr:PspC domain-containing protein [Candidatus Dormibacteraeota bacterium]